MAEAWCEKFLGWMERSGQTRAAEDEADGREMDGGSFRGMRWRGDIEGGGEGRRR